MTRSITTENAYKIYRSKTAGRSPAAGSLFEGELAVNLADTPPKLWIGNPAGDPVEMDFKQIPDYSLATAKRYLQVNDLGTDLVWVTPPEAGIANGGKLDVRDDPTLLAAVTHITIYQVKVSANAHTNFPNIGGESLTVADYLIRTPSNQWIVLNNLADLREEFDALIKGPSTGILTNDGTGTSTWTPTGVNKKGQLTNDGSGGFSWVDTVPKIFPEYSATEKYLKNNFIVFNGEMYKCLANTNAGQSPTTDKGMWKILASESNKTFVQDTSPTPLLEGDQWFDTSGSGGSSYVAIKQGTSLIWVDSDGRGDIAALSDIGVRSWDAKKTYSVNTIIAFQGSLYTVQIPTTAGQNPTSAPGSFAFYDTGSIVQFPASTQTITSARGGNTPLILKGAAGQTANLFDVGDSTGAHKVTVDKDANLHATGKGQFDGNVGIGGLTPDTHSAISGVQRNNTGVVSGLKMSFGYTGAVDQTGNNGAVIRANAYLSVTGLDKTRMFGADVGSNQVFEVMGDGSLMAAGTKINFANLPTSATGLATGDLWNDGGTLKIA